MPGRLNIPDFDGRLEVHFYEEKVGAVVFETPAKGGDLQKAELATFAMFAIGQLVIIPRSHAEGVAMLFSALSYPEVFAKVMFPNRVLDLEMVPFRGPGKYQFHGSPQKRPPANKPSMRTKAKGFGWFFGPPIPPYVGYAVPMVLNYLFNLRDDVDHQERLTRTAMNVGKQVLEGRAGIMNQYDVAFAAWTQPYLKYLQVSEGDM